MSAAPDRGQGTAVDIANMIPSLGSAAAARKMLQRLRDHQTPSVRQAAQPVGRNHTGARLYDLDAVWNAHLRRPGRGSRRHLRN
jgi:hypothetical protein